MNRNIAPTWVILTWSITTGLLIQAMFMFGADAIGYAFADPSGTSSGAATLMVAAAWGVFSLIAIAMFWVPTMISTLRRMPNVDGVFIVNLATGWTGLGWFAALIMACLPARQPVTVTT